MLRSVLKTKTLNWEIKEKDIDNTWVIRFAYIHAMCNPPFKIQIKITIYYYEPNNYFEFIRFTILCCVYCIFFQCTHDSIKKMESYIQKQAFLVLLFALHYLWFSALFALHARIEGFRCVLLKINTAKPNACIRREESVLELWAQLTAWRKSFTQPIVRLVSFAHSVDSENANQSHAAQSRSACNWIHFLDANSTNK